MSKILPIQRAGFILATIWLGCFSACLAIPIVMVVVGMISSGAFLKAIDKISILFVPYVGVLMAFYLVSRPRKQISVSRPTFIVAITGTIIWNTTILAFVVAAALVPQPSGQPLEDSLEVAVGVAQKLAWIVAPIFGYFFGKQNEQPT